MPESIKPGLLVLHGNRLELLKEAVFDWLARQPLAPLEEEIFLVQSNGVAEWLKMALAQSRGICAATRVELPARFLWRSYRQVLGARAVPVNSPLDKSALTWRLMRLLPERASQAGFEPLAGFLNPVADTGRRLQLAQRLADLYDQYQVYRGDWLAAWANGDDAIGPLAASSGAPAEPPGRPGKPGAEPASHRGARLPLPREQRWQAALWRAVLEALTEAEQATARPELHRSFLRTLESGAPPQMPVARRVVLFGMSHVPLQTLEALAALSERSQVLLAIPNPCRYHWADIMEGRELLRFARQRHTSRGVDLASLSLEDLHVHANPLLASWGRQGRDFVRQLDAFDDARASRERFAVPTIELFDDGPGETLLGQVQADIRDLVPLGERIAKAAAGTGAGGQFDESDRSIVFHVAHGTQREVEILHDQLLALFAAAPSPDHSEDHSVDQSAAGEPDGPGLSPPPLRPRDIVVMVPSIDTFAPSIRAVFGQYQRSDPRFIPFDIADLQQRGNNPVVAAVEWLLRLPQQRCRLAEIRDLLDVPAVAARFGIAPDDLPKLTQWMNGAGVRWGLHAEQRGALGLDACGDQNTWLFGLRRMLLGYANGNDADFAGIEPYGEVGGLDAALAGSLASLVQALMDWWQLGSTASSPSAWAEQGRTLLSNFLKPADEKERLTVAALQDALRGWLDDCETAGFDEPVPLAVMREAWLGGIDEPRLGKRFLAGGVTFCTLLPMRAVPFDVVCLLGMNDGDYPRSSTRSDFDLMAWPGQRRPGDRSRRDDDRYLMLEALLAARRLLYVSWTGRSARDNSEQPPSVLVSQLRDYLAAGWGIDVVKQRTTEHPLQAFSRRYFESDEEAVPVLESLRGGQASRPATSDVGPGPTTVHRPLVTWAREWRSAHVRAANAGEPRTMPVFEPAGGGPLTIKSLARFLRDPVKTFFADRLDVRFQDGEAALEDDEVFVVDALSDYQLLHEVLDSARAGDDPARQAARIQRSGRLPMGRQGDHARLQLVGTAEPMLAAWREWRALYPMPVDKAPLHVESDGVALHDWLDGAFMAAGSHGAEHAAVHIDFVASKLLEAKGPGSGKPSRLQQLRVERLIEPWVRMLVASTCGFPSRTVIVGRDAVLTAEPLGTDAARPLLEQLLQGWRDGMLLPLPLARKTGIALVGGADVETLIRTYEGGHAADGEIARDPCLARAFPTYEALVEDGGFEPLARQLYGPLVEWAAGRVDVRRYEAGMTT